MSSDKHAIFVQVNKSTYLRARLEEMGWFASALNLCWAARVSLVQEHSSGICSRVWERSSANAAETFLCEHRYLYKCCTRDVGKGEGTSKMGTSLKLYCFHVLAPHWAESQPDCYPTQMGNLETSCNRSCRGEKCRTCVQTLRGGEKHEVMESELSFPLHVP